MTNPLLFLNLKKIRDANAARLFLARTAEPHSSAAEISIRASGARLRVAALKADAFLIRGKLFPAGGAAFFLHREGALITAKTPRKLLGDLASFCASLGGKKGAAAETKIKRPLR